MNKASTISLRNLLSYFIQDYQTQRLIPLSTVQASKEKSK
jgi:hypothetical protein